MRVFNKDKTQELDSYDPNLGILEPDVIITHYDAEIVRRDAVIAHHDAVIVHHDAVTVHHDAVVGRQEQGHYETVAEYPNGGKDVRWVIDVPSVTASDAYDEVITPAYDEIVTPAYDEIVLPARDEVVTEAHDDIEDILVYTPYTQRWLLDKELEECTEWLQQHDYIGVKIATGRATIDEYADAIAEMRIKADRINQIKQELLMLEIPSRNSSV